MNITRKSEFTGVVRTRNINCTVEQMTKYEQGELLQFAFPKLSAEDREFIKTGITGEEWESIFTDQKEDLQRDGVVFSPK